MKRLHVHIAQAEVWWSDEKMLKKLLFLAKNSLESPKRDRVLYCVGGGSMRINTGESLQITKPISSNSVVAHMPWLKCIHQSSRNCNAIV